MTTTRRLLRLPAASPHPHSDLKLQVDVRRASGGASCSRPCGPGLPFPTAYCVAPSPNSGIKETLAPRHVETMQALFELLLSAFRDLHSHRSQNAPEAHPVRARPTPGSRHALAPLLPH